MNDAGSAAAGLAEVITAEVTERLRSAGLDPDQVTRLVLAALAEDLGGGTDVTSEATVAADAEGTGRLVARQDGVAAGLPVAAMVFHVAAALGSARAEGDADAEGAAGGVAAVGGAALPGGAAHSGGVAVVGDAAVASGASLAGGAALPSGVAVVGGAALPGGAGCAGERGAQPGPPTGLAARNPPPASLGWPGGAQRDPEVPRAPLVGTPPPASLGRPGGGQRDPEAAQAPLADAPRPASLGWPGGTAPPNRPPASLAARTAQPLRQCWPGGATPRNPPNAPQAARTAQPLRISYHAADGERIRRGQTLLTVTGGVRTLLLAERTALNLVCHLSGIATLTRRWVDEVAGTGAKIRDTRKTLPGLRALQKYAVRCGGGLNHRMSLSDAVLVKDNHVTAAGCVSAAFAAVTAAASGPPGAGGASGLPVEVECDTLAQVTEVAGLGAEVILLDNFAVAEMAEAVAIVVGRARLEASGGLTLERARAVAATGVDYLAVGALTHSAPALDIGLDLAPGGAGR